MGDNAGLRRPPLRESIHRRHHPITPAHHVVSKLESSQSMRSSKTSSTAASDVGSLPAAIGFGITSTKTVDSTTPSHHVRTGFRNPWPSWHKPNAGEVWNGLRWTQKVESSTDTGLPQEDSCPIDDDAKDDQKLYSLDSSKEGLHQENDNEDLLLIQPDFHLMQDNTVQATWLGHASVLLQLPSLKGTESSRLLRVLFDPIFSMRCSPTQYFGPLRSYPPPCTISSLPEIDVVIISHSHFDHLDYDTIVQLWQAHQEYIRFVVPLGNKEWFLSLHIGIGDDRVTELDWWDETRLDEEGTDGEVNLSNHLRVICTPAQHGSGRYGLDASRTLWASWTLEWTRQGKKFIVFFGGDTGFQFQSSAPDAQTYPTCPAFAEVAAHIGKPDLSFLPVSVGASLNFVRSYDVLGLVPQLDGGLMGANHLTPQDAVRVALLMQGPEQSKTYSIQDSFDYQNSLLCTQGGGKRAGTEKGSRQRVPIVMAIHWGTFVSGPDEVQDTMRNLREECRRHGISFVRRLDERERTEEKCPALHFACVNHGQSIFLDLGSRTGTDDD